MRNCNKLPSLGLCSNPQPAYLNPTKCFQPLSSDYTWPWKLWLASKTSIGGAGGSPKMALGLAQKACATATKCHLWAYVATPNQHIWTQPSVSNHYIVSILDLGNFGWGQRRRWRQWRRPKNGLLCTKILRGLALKRIYVHHFKKWWQPIEMISNGPYNSY